MTQFSGFQLVRQQADPIQEEHREGTGRGQRVRHQESHRAERGRGRHGRTSGVTLPFPDAPPPPPWHDAAPGWLGRRLRRERVSP